MLQAPKDGICALYRIHIIMDYFIRIKKANIQFGVRVVIVYVLQVIDIMPPF